MVRFNLKEFKMCRLILLCGCLLFVFCQKECDHVLTIHPSEKEMVYFNSFESFVDTTNEVEQTRNNWGAPSCGEQSFHIAGGCIQPAAQFVIPATVSGSYQLGVWAMLDQMEQPGELVMRDSKNRVSFPVVDEAWTYYLSEPLDNVQKGDTLYVEGYIGGYIPAEMRIDCLMIEATLN